MSATLTLAPDDGDAAIAARLRRLLRATGDAPVLIDGMLDAGFDDAEAAFTWLTLLTSSRQPVLLRAAGTLGQRGTALLFASDLAFVAPDASLGEVWRDTPRLAALALRRCGAAQARALLFGGLETLADLEKAGLVLPLAFLEERYAHFDSRALAGFARRKRALRAAEALPFDEALNFGLAFLDKEAVA
jgi:hypothetical protein